MFCWWSGGKKIAGEGAILLIFEVLLTPRPTCPPILTVPQRVRYGCTS